MSSNEFSIDFLTKEDITFEPIKVTDSKEVIKKKLNEQAKALRGVVTHDAFQNQMARLGYDQPNLVEGAQYPNTRISFNYNLFNSMYRSSWIVRKIIDVIPSDMLKNWIKITSELEPANIKKIERCITRTNTKVKIKQGLKWARLYGGAIGLILIEGHDNLSEPLDYDFIMPDSYKGMLIFDRWTGVEPSFELVSNVNNTEYGMPKYYNIDLNASNTNPGIMLGKLDESSIIKVHHSRVIRFEGRDLPFYEQQFENGWGESEIEIALEELKKRDNTSYNIASLIFLANIRVFKMNDLGQLLGAGSQLAQQNLYQTLNAQNYLMSNMGMFVMDKDDDFVTEQYSFSGLNDIYESFMLDVAGATEMPVTKLFGRNPAGFNATGESDLIQYYETLEEKQESYLLPVINKLLPIICMSTLGAIPNDLEWEFNPCMSINNKDLADLAQNLASPIFDAYNNGIISKTVALKELRQQMDKTGMWSNITDEVINEAAEEQSENFMNNEESNNLINEMYNNTGSSGSGSDNPFENGNPNPKPVNGINRPEQERSSEGKSEPFKWKDRLNQLLRKGG